MLILIPLLIVVLVLGIAGGYYVRHSYYGATAAQHRRLMPKPLALAAVGVLAVVAVVLVVLIITSAGAKSTHDKTNNLLGGSGGTTQQP